MTSSYRYYLYLATSVSHSYVLLHPSACKCRYPTPMFRVCFSPTSVLQAGVCVFPGATGNNTASRRAAVAASEPLHELIFAIPQLNLDVIRQTLEVSVSLPVGLSACLCRYSVAFCAIPSVSLSYVLCLCLALSL